MPKGKIDDKNKVHIRRKKCVICMSGWEIEWKNNESFIEWITCPNCRYKAIDIP